MRRILTIQMMLIAAAAAAYGESPMSCVDLQLRYDEIKADPLKGDTWLDLKSAFFNQQAALVDEDKPEPGTTSVTYASKGCAAIFQIRDGRVKSKSYKIAATGLDVSTPKAPAPVATSPEMATKIAQFEAALLRLKLQASEMETLLLGMKQLAAASGTPVHEASATAPVSATPASVKTVRTPRVPARPATAPQIPVSGARSRAAQ